MVVACATYEAPPGGNDQGEAGNSGKAGGGAASSGQAGTAPTAGTAVSQAGSGGSSSAGTAGTGGTSGTAGIVGSGGAPGGEGGQGVGEGGQGGDGEGGEPPSVTDNCPNDPAKTAPGVCGCGFPDTDTAQLASCTGLKSALVHRYDFEGTGTVVSDRVGIAHGSVKGGASLSKVGGKGVIVLAGGAAGSYVDLPNELLSSLTNATVEAWITWGGGDSWQRVFDFGDTTNASPEDNPAEGKSYLFLTPRTDAGVMRATYSLSGNSVANETRLPGTAPLPQVLTHVAVVVDATGDKLLLYMDGAKVGEQAFTGNLGSINDVNCWLGRSQYSTDPALTGTFHDFRLYEAALAPLQIATSFAGGADPAFLAQ